MRKDAVGVGLVRWAGVGFGSEEQEVGWGKQEGIWGGNGRGQGGRWGEGHGVGNPSSCSL